MREIGDSKQCPYCGYHADSAQLRPYLPVRTVIANRYLVGKMLEYNGEGATYIGWDLSEKKAVRIREFIPDSFTARASSNLTLQVMRGSESVFAELRQDFVELWTKLAKLKGLSALISVSDVVDDYGTSYAIYDHFEGITLREFLLRNKEGYITWDKAKQLLMPILSTLSTLHSQGIIHRGISPSTLIIGNDGRVKITGFCLGAARTARSDLNSQLYDGYSAIEQYGFEGSQGTWTDIYSFGAVLYRTLIGSDPISAKERMTNDRLMVPGKFAETLPAYVINGLVNALQILPEDRTRTVEQLRAELSASPTAAAVSGQYQRPATAPVIPSAAPQAPASNSQKSQKSKKGGAQVVVTTAVISLAVGLILFIALTLTVFRDKINFSFDSPKTHSPAVSQTQTEQVAVPDFKDKSYISIESNPVFFNNFKFREEPVFNDEITKGYVISQDIPPETMVPKGTEIVLYVSKGKEQVLLPYVVGMDYEEAAARLEELGFVCNRIDVSEGNYRENEVISMNLIANTTHERGTTVGLKVFIPETEPVSEPLTDEYGETVEEEISEDDFYVGMPEENDVVDDTIQ